MTVTWRSAVSYALTVVVLSWLTGAGVDLAWRVASGGLRGWVSFWAADPWNAVFVVTAVLALTLVRRMSAALPNWRVALIDGAVYLGVLLLCSGISAWAAGDEGPVDAAFFMAILALFTFQLPAAWLLSAWRSPHLEIVLGRAGARGRATV
ncbi:hypothetical protein [Streptomyces corynorhini]|uniref:Uncharacterized protein n=1 Tax=Streptomyces corynorhini TaxID=2282652 RepID=A0A370B788_9ACTN|nr:hypothetical protein [Streptomyces corynorhini]RDG35606.1 hypothetical protein DVH02_24445 [Streptomyces corynorhini]